MRLSERVYTNQPLPRSDLWLTPPAAAVAAADQAAACGLLHQPCATATVQLHLTLLQATITAH